MPDDAPSPTPGSTRPGSATPGALGDFLKVARFYSRLPVPGFRAGPDPHGLPDFACASWAIPLVGAMIGGCGALVGLAAYLLGLSTTLAAILTVATLVIVTGAFHEDGLADSCDGLWGGATRERRLEIMKDSRVGTFGAAGLTLSLALRIFALAELFRLIGPWALVLVVGIAAASRPLALIPVLMLPPARKDGLASDVPLPGPAALAAAIGIGLAILAGCGYWLNLLPGIVTAILVLLVVMLGAVRIAARKIGGHTGDILGACQQVTEIVFLLVLSAAVNWTGPM